MKVNKETTMNYELDTYLC